MHAYISSYNHGWILQPTELTCAGTYLLHVVTSEANEPPKALGSSLAPGYIHTLY